METADSPTYKDIDQLMEGGPGPESGSPASQEEEMALADRPAVTQAVKDVLAQVVDTAEGEKKDLEPVVQEEVERANRLLNFQPASFPPDAAYQEVVRLLDWERDRPDLLKLFTLLKAEGATENKTEITQEAKRLEAALAEQVGFLRQTYFKGQAFTPELLQEEGDGRSAEWLLRKRIIPGLQIEAIEALLDEHRLTELIDSLIQRNQVKLPSREYAPNPQILAQLAKLKNTIVTDPELLTTSGEINLTTQQVLIAQLESIQQDYLEALTAAQFPAAVIDQDIWNALDAAEERYHQALPDVRR